MTEHTHAHMKPNPTPSPVFLSPSRHSNANQWHFIVTRHVSAQANTKPVVFINIELEFKTVHFHKVVQYFAKAMPLSRPFLGSTFLIAVSPKPCVATFQTFNSRQATGQQDIVFSSVASIKRCNKPLMSPFKCTRLLI